MKISAALRFRISRKPSFPQHGQTGRRKHLERGHKFGPSTGHAAWRADSISDSGLSHIAVIGFAVSGQVLILSTPDPSAIAGLGQLDPLAPTS